KVELRRGDDWTLLSTEARHAAYAPEKLSMEKTESAFSPEDRIGALELQNIGIADNRALLHAYAGGVLRASELGDPIERLVGEDEWGSGTPAGPTPGGCGSQHEACSAPMKGDGGGSCRRGRLKPRGPPPRASCAPARSPAHSG